jgi:hypothetical protein
VRGQDEGSEQYGNCGDRQKDGSASKVVRIGGQSFHKSPQLTDVQMLTALLSVRVVLLQCGIGHCHQALAPPTGLAGVLPRNLVPQQISTSRRFRVDRMRVPGSSLGLRVSISGAEEYMEEMMPGISKRVFVMWLRTTA